MNLKQMPKDNEDTLDDLLGELWKADAYSVGEIQMQLYIMLSRLHRSHYDTRRFYSELGEYNKLVKY